GKTPVGFDKKKLECFNCHNTGHFARECIRKGTHDGKKRKDSFYQHQEARKQKKNQIGLLTMDDGIVNWGEHTEDEETNQALMAISSSSEVSLCSKTSINSYNELKILCDEQMNQLGDQEVQILAYSQAVKKLEAQLVNFQKQQLSLNEKLTFQANEIYEKDEKHKKYRRIGMKAVKEKEQLQKTLDSWKDSSKNLWRLINSGMSSSSKHGLGYEIKSNNEVLSYEEEMNFFVFNCTEEDSVGKPLYNRFIKTNDFKGVPHPLSGDYTPKPQEKIDESLFIYGKKGPQEPEPSILDDRSSEYSTCQSNDSAGSIGTSSEHSVDLESEISRVPQEVYVSKPITTNEKGVFAPKSKEVEPSCVTHIKTPRQPIKDQETPKVNRKNWNAMMERELGEGYSFTKKKCFVCGSLSHLIKDCDYYEKKMAREAEFKKQRVFNTGNGVAKPVWTNANRVNHANQFVPRSVQLNAGRPNINYVRPNVNTGRVNVNSVRPNVNTGRVNVNSVKSNVNTGRTNVNPVRPRVNTGSSNVNTVRSRQPVPTKTSNSFSPKRPQVNQLNQRRHFSKSHSPVSRPIVRNTARMTYSHAVKGNWGTAVKTSAGYNWRKTRPNSNYDSRSNFVKTVNVKGPQGRPKPVKAWTATANTLADGTLELHATIDTIVYTITEASIRNKLQLADASGITMLPNNEIFEGMGHMGYPTDGSFTFWKSFFTPQWRFLVHHILHCISSKSGGWDQFGSNIATALICLSTGRVYNFSKLIFDGMVANLKSKTKFLMYPHFLQLILDIQTENKHPYLAVTLTKKIFGNMKRGFQGAPRPLLPSMLLVATNLIAGQEHAAQAQTQPIPPPPPIPSPTPTPIPSPTPTPIPSPTPTPIPTSTSPPPPIPSPTPPPIPTPTSPPPPPPETEPPTDEHTYEEQSPVHHHFSPSQAQAPSHMPTDDLLQTVPKLISRIDSLELDLKQTKLTMGNAIVKLVKKVKKLEGFLKRRNLVLTDSEDEEPEVQGRKSQADPQDSSKQGLVTPPTTKAHASGEEQEEEISPNTLEAAKTLSKVASLKSRSIDKGRRYKRRKESTGKKVVSSLDFQEDNTGAEKINTAGEVNAASIEVNTASKVNTGSIELNTVIEQDSTAGENKGQREGKAPMLSEETPKKTKEQILQEEASLAEAAI
ncbi:ribonuclease H-like domain-containing protein, partial [Tanacetum coccineum]